MNEIDILRSATLLVKRYGNNALLHSGACHVRFHEQGDYKAARVWLRIDNAIVDMLYPEYVIRDEHAASH